MGRKTTARVEGILRWFLEQPVFPNKLGLFKFNVFGKLIPKLTVVTIFTIFTILAIVSNLIKPVIANFFPDLFQSVFTGLFSDLFEHELKHFFGHRLHHRQPETQVPGHPVSS